MVTKGLANLDVPRMLAAVNSIFERGEFPAQWKTNRLTIIRKPGKDPTRPEAYCPISIVDAGSKIDPGVPVAGQAFAARGFGWLLRKPVWVQKGEVNDIGIGWSQTSGGGGHKEAALLRHSDL